MLDRAAQRLHHSASQRVRFVEGSVMRHINPDCMRSLVTRGLLSEEDMERFRAALTAFNALPDAYTLWLFLMVCGEKPCET